MYDYSNLYQTPIHTCKVVETIILEHIIQHREDIPHTLGDKLTGETIDQGQQLIVELWNDMNIGKVILCDSGYKTEMKQNYAFDVRVTMHNIEF